MQTAPLTREEAIQYVILQMLAWPENKKITMDVAYHKLQQILNRVLP